jgi:predicted ribosome quality control (RQC) complex YloA/Tae2 family protein
MNIHKFYSHSGKTILVGKDAKSNNYLTFKTAQNNDIFLHTSDLPGSHVILQGKASNEDLKDAAQLAAYFSKGRSRKIVKVDYTEKYNVSRRRNAPQGEVEIKTFQTLKIASDSGRLKRLLKTKTTLL